MKNLSELLYRLMSEEASPRKRKKRREMLDQVYSNIAKMLVTPTFYVVDEHKFDGFLFTALFSVVTFEFRANRDYLPARLWLFDAVANGNGEARVMLAKFEFSITRLREETSKGAAQGDFIQSGLVDLPAYCLLKHKYVVDAIIAAWKLHTVYGLSVSASLNGTWSGRGAGGWQSVVQAYLPKEEAQAATDFFNTARA